jgi:hypothetical protein
MHDRYIAVAISMLQLYAVRSRYEEMGDVLQMPTAVMAVLALALNAAACHKPGNAGAISVAAVLASAVWAVLAATVCSEQASAEAAAYVVLLLCAFYYGVHHIEDVVEIPAVLAAPQVGAIRAYDGGNEVRITSPLRLTS